MVQMGEPPRECGKETWSKACAEVSLSKKKEKGKEKRKESDIRSRPERSQHPKRKGTFSGETDGPPT